MRTKHFLFALLTVLCLVTAWAQPFDADIRQTADYKQAQTWVPVLLRDNAASYRTNLGVSTNILVENALSFTTNGQVVANTGTNNLTFSNEVTFNTAIIQSANIGGLVLAGGVFMYGGDDQFQLYSNETKFILPINFSSSNVAATTRTNLGLGTASTKDSPTTGNASSTQVVLGNDTRLSDARTPSSTLAHAASHAAAGSDPLAPSDIGAQSIFTPQQVDLTSANVTLTASRAKIISTLNFAGVARQLDLPTTGNQVGDTFIVRRASGNADVVIYQNIGGGSTLGTITSGFPSDRQYEFTWNGSSWILDKLVPHTHPASEISDSTTAGRALLTGADAAAQRTTLGLGSGITTNRTFVANGVTNSVTISNGIITGWTQ